MEIEMQRIDTRLLHAAALVVTVVLAGCSSPTAAPAAPAAAAAGAATTGIHAPAATDLTISGDAMRTCGLETSSPQMYIFDGAGKLASTEIGFAPDSPLNIESGKPGRGVDNVAKLQSCLQGAGVAPDTWTACGADFCVIRILPDATVGHCPYCDQSQLALDAYFGARHANVVYHTLYFK
jgi:hypothetical protein